MKRRLRKKRRLGEFREDGFRLQFQVDESLSLSETDVVVDSFIDMIEANRLQFGGGGDSSWTGIVQGPWRGTATEADRDSVLEWLHAHPQIVDASAGPLEDLWNGRIA